MKLTGNQQNTIEDKETNMITFENQKIIHINKNIKDNFLQIPNQDWMESARMIKAYGTFKLYLYLSSNMDGFNLALSRVAVVNKLGISENTYHKAVRELIDMKYLVCKQ